MAGMSSYVTPTRGDIRGAGYDFNPDPYNLMDEIVKRARYAQGPYRPPQRVGAARPEPPPVPTGGGGGLSAPDPMKEIQLKMARLQLQQMREQMMSPEQLGLIKRLTYPGAFGYQEIQDLTKTPYYLRPGNVEVSAIGMGTPSGGGGYGPGPSYGASQQAQAVDSGRERAAFFPTIGQTLAQGNARNLATMKQLYGDEYGG